MLNGTCYLTGCWKLRSAFGAILVIIGPSKGIYQLARSRHKTGTMKAVVNSSDIPTKLVKHLTVNRAMSLPVPVSYLALLFLAIYPIANRYHATIDAIPCQAELEDE